MRRAPKKRKKKKSKENAADASAPLRNTSSVLLRLHVFAEKRLARCVSRAESRTAKITAISAGEDLDDTLDRALPMEANHLNPPFTTR